MIRMNLLGALVLAAAVAGCGVDGPPQRPAEPLAVTPGITVTGDARFGMRTNDL